MLNVKIDTTTFHLGRWYEYVIRFVLGGIATVITGILAKEFGPAIGGLFLALPAILPASTTLVQTHETKKKRRAGLNGVSRAKKVAGLDAAGAAMGSFGMMAFAVYVWVLLPKWPAWVVLASATVVWFAVAFVVWRQRKVFPRLLHGGRAAISSRR